MFLKLNHQKLEIFRQARKLVIECYRITSVFPSAEKFNMVSQIRRAAISVFLNTTEGSSRKSESERKRFYEIARGSVIEIDGAMDISNELGYLKETDTSSLGESVVICFKLLTGLILSKKV